MKIKSFYKTQREVAEVLNYLVDAYWEDTINEDCFIEKLNGIHENNPMKIIKNDQFTTIIKQHCGKRRLEVVERILNLTNTHK